MFELFLVHLAILFFCISAGFLFYRVLPGEQGWQRPLVMLFFTGLVIYSSIAQVIALFFPVNFIVQLLLILITLLLLALNRKSFIPFLRSVYSSALRMRPLYLIAITSCWILVLVICAGPIINDDTDCYHIPMVKWISEYGTVPGLANLHSRYGFNSSWFMSISVLTPQGLIGQFYTSLNSLISFVFTAYLISKLANPRFALSAAVVLVLSLASWPVIRGNATSAGYDLITAFMVIVLLMESLRLVVEKSGRHFTTELLLWPVFLFSIRIVNFPLLILSAASVYLLWRANRKQLMILAACSLLIIIPFLIRNLILSGYLFFPSMAVDLFAVDWKADPDRTKRLVDFIRYFNRVNTRYQETEVTAGLSYSQWIPLWFRYMFNYDKLIFFPAVAGIFVALAGLRKTFFSGSLVYRLFIATFLLQLLLWFFVAPDPRFALGPILSFCFLLVFIPITIPVSWTRLLVIPVALCCLSLAAYSVFARRDSISRIIVHPLPLPVPGAQPILIGNIPVYLPARFQDNFNLRCYGTELPCLYEIYPGLEMRGPSIKNGFRLSKTRDKSKASGL
ncbi:MAG: hypothetical protein ABWZ25_09150 [Chitinophagaceae bacterium]